MTLLAQPIPLEEKEPEYRDELADFVNEEYTKRQNARRPFELQWRLNSEFLAGNQFVDIDPVSNTIREVPKLFWYQEREVFNQIGVIVETRISRLNRQRPIMKVRPASNDNEDISAARVSSMLLNSTWFDQEMDALYGDLIAWLELTGTVFIKTFWNPNRGRTIEEDFVNQSEEMPQAPMAQDPYNVLSRPPAERTPENLEENQSTNGGMDNYRDQPDKPTEPYQGISFEDESENPSLNEEDPFLSNFAREQLKEGDVETTIVPPYQIFPDNNYADGISKIRSIIHAQAFHIDEIEDMWDIRVEPEETAVNELERMKSGLGGVGYNAYGFKSSPKEMKDHAVLKEYYERPSKKYPLGRFIVVAGNRTLHAGPLPYEIGKNNEVDLPFIPIKSIPNPGCFWGKSIIERCIPIQRRYNTLRNRKAEYLNLVSIGQWYEPIGSVDEDTELNNAPGARIRYRPGIGQPQPVQFPNLPASFENEIQTLLQEFTAVSGVSELSRYSEAPSGVRSGVALSIANEQDDTRLAMTTTKIANGIIRLGKYWLRLYKQFAIEPRILRTVGESREVEVMQWTASDLRSDDVIVENTSALAETPAQRRQMIFDLLGTGIFNRPETSPFDEETRAKLFEMMEFGNWEQAGDEMIRLQKSRAKRENADMLKAMPSDVRDYDDHAIHIMEHEKFRLSSDYEQVLETEFGPIIDELFTMHIQVHREALAEIQMQQMEQQMAAQLQGGEQ